MIEFITFFQAYFQRLENPIAVEKKNPIQTTTAPFQLASPKVSQELSTKRKRELGDNEKALHYQSPEKINDSNNHNQHKRDSKYHQSI